MLSVQNVYVQYGDRILLNQVSFSLQLGERIGLVGVNGAGKSTTLKIIAGQMLPQQGHVSLPKGARIGFLHQDMNIPSGKTVIEETMTAFDEVKRVEAQLEAVQNALNEREDYESDAYLELINQLSELTEQLNVLDSDTMQAQSEKILMGLGFKTADFHRQTSTFSGGWQMRIELAKMLLQKPEYLLLDEPTNHLDIESIIWLEQFLQTYEGCVVLISHDRTFLDNVCKRTIEVELGKIYDYKANYSRYLELRAERRSLQQAAYDNQQREIARKEALIDKFRAKANKASFAQSLMKELDRMDKIELDQENSAVMRLRFQPAPRSGEVALRADKVHKSYGKDKILENLDLEVIRGQRLAFVGKNGEGKSTFMKILCGLIDAYEGEVTQGHNICLGYYAQNQADVLDPKKTVLETIEQGAPYDLRPKLRTILGSFLFSGEDVDKKVSVLSGGERARLALACLLIHPINLLLLDEPTNHLDLRSKEVLKEALLHYDGTLIVVSHDRDFLTGLTDHTIEFANRQIRTYLGDVQYFLEKRQFDSLRHVSVGKKEEQNTNPQNKPNPNNTADPQALKKVQKQVQQAEKDIAKLEQELGKIQNQLAQPDAYQSPDFQKLSQEYRKLEQELEETMQIWEQALETLETLAH